MQLKQMFSRFRLLTFFIAAGILIVAGTIHITLARAQSGSPATTSTDSELIAQFRRVEFE